MTRMMTLPSQGQVEQVESYGLPPILCSIFIWLFKIIHLNVMPSFLNRIEIFDQTTQFQTLRKTNNFHIVLYIVVFNYNIY